jgi:hypothetical protein
MQDQFAGGQADDRDVPPVVRAENFQGIALQPKVVGDLIHEELF